MQDPMHQPIGFWATKAGAAVVARTRGALADLALSQPQWWVLHQLSIHPDGMSPQAVIDIVGPNDTNEAIVEAIRTSSAAGWIDGDDLLRLTADGRALFDRAAEVQRDLQAERMTGVTDDDFATTITVLQRIISNVGGQAWHW